MAKYLFRKGLLGFLIGIAVQYIAAIAVSLFLRLGYLLPYPASFPERFGGEMNTIVIVTLACGLTGAAIGVGMALFTKYRKTHIGTGVLDRIAIGRQPNS